MSTQTKFANTAIRLSFAAATLIGTLAFAEDTYQLDRSVVSASGFAQDTKDAPASISVITKDELEKKPFKDIGEAISGIPGVDVTMNKTGTYDFSIRGFGSSYVLVLIDGKRQSVANGFYSSGFSGSESGYLPPLSMIERIEVIRGPASTLYGSDAVGGVINIITRKNPATTQGSIDFSTLLNQHSNRYGNAGGFSGYISTPLIENTLSLSARLKYYDKAGSNLSWPTSTYQLGSGGRSGIVGRSRSRGGGTGSSGSGSSTTNAITAKADNYNIANHSPGSFQSIGFGSRLNWSLDEKNNVYFDAERYVNRISVRSTSGRAIQSDRQIFKDNLVLNYDGSFEFGQLNSYAQYGSTWENKDGGFHSQIYVGETKAVLPWDLGVAGNLITSLGTRADYETLKGDSKIQSALKSQVTAAAYGEGEYFITNDLILTGGLRYIYSNLFKSELTPRAYAIYHLTDWLSFKAGVAKGYKTPAAKQLSKGYYALGSDSASFGNPKLKPEESINYELGVDFAVLDWARYTVTGFITNFDNQIGSENITGDFSGIKCADTANSTNSQLTCTRPINLGRTKVRGVELAFASAKFDGFSLESTYTFMDNRYVDKKNVLKTGPDSDRIENLPRHLIMAKLNYEYANLSSFIKGRARLDTIAKSKGGGSRALPWRKYRPFYIVDLGLNYKLDKQSSLSFNIQNLLDTNFFDPRPTGYVNNDKTKPSGYANRYQDYTEGRSFWVGYKYNF